MQKQYLLKYIDKNDLLNGIYSENPKDVMLYIANFPTADVVSKELYDQVKFERDALQEMIDNLEQWIPVSERLPEDEGWYLVTDYSGGVRWLEVEFYDPEFGLKPFWSVQNPVAWMPLPDPWKGEDDGKG